MFLQTLKFCICIEFFFSLIPKIASVIDIQPLYGQNVIFSDSVPVDDVFLSDLNGTYFFNQTKFHDEIHTQVKSNPLPDREISEISPTDRLLVLLPTKTTKTGEELWVPYLIVTGSPQTFLTNRTRFALNIPDYSLHYEIYIAGVKIRFGCSTNRFEDINILGTDILSRGNLVVSYEHREFGLRIQDFYMNLPSQNEEVLSEIGFTSLKNPIIHKILIASILIMLIAMLILIIYFKNKENKTLKSNEDFLSSENEILKSQIGKNITGKLYDQKISHKNNKKKN